MAKEKKRKGKSKKGTQTDRDIDVHLVPAVKFLHEHISEALCEEIFQNLRDNERERKWSLFALSRFWLAVTLEAPPSLSQLLERTRQGDPRGFLPLVEASAEAFFQKCKGFSYGFFMALYNHFIDKVLPKAPKRYGQKVEHLQKKFSELLVIDGSRLDKIAHRLKILWLEEAAILPGCLTAVYDLFRGISRQLWFDSDAAASEFNRGLTAVECLPHGTLLLGDRLYCSIQLFHALKEKDCFGLFRRNKSVGIRKIRQLSKVKLDEGTLEDWLVEAGSGKEKIELRLIVLEKEGETYEAFTNALDPNRLSAEDIVALYPLRWTVERLFYDLKEVLNLKKFYAANPNAVAMQVYAAAIVHVAFRIAQADIAKQVKVPPEELSPKKLFPHLALVSIILLGAECYFEATCNANPKVKLLKPSWNDLPDSIVSLKRIRVERRSEERRKSQYSEERRKWKSITKVVDEAEELS